MTLFTDDPDLKLPTFEPRFGVRRLIVDRGGVYSRRRKDGLLNEVPAGLKLDSLSATLLAIDPIVVALTFAGYDAREIIVGTSNNGDIAAQALGYLRGSLRSGYGHSIANSNWSTLLHITDPGTYHSIVAIRVFAWRRESSVPVVPVNLDTVDSYQRWKQTGDLDGDDADGWILLGHPDELMSSVIAGKAVPEVVAQIVSAIRGGMAVSQSPGLLRILDPSGWVVPRERETPIPALLAAADTLWNGAMSQPTGLDLLIGVGASGTAGLDESSNSLRSWLAGLDPGNAEQTLWDLAVEMEVRRRLLEPLEASLEGVLDRLEATHWALAVMQLHEFGMIDALPLPAPTPPAIPKLDVTGFYESIPDAFGDFIATMQLNQAGDELRGFWVDSQMQVWPIEATFDATALATDTFQFSVLSTADGATGTMSLSPVPTGDPLAFGFHVRWGTERPWSMGRRDRRGRILPAAVVDRLGQTQNLLQLEPLLHPIHRVLHDRVILYGYEIVQMIGTTSAVILTGASQAVRAMDTTAVDHAVRDGLAVEVSATEFEPLPLLYRMRVELRNYLGRTPIPEAAGVDGWTQLRSIVTLYPAESVGMQALFDITLDTPHNYEYTLKGQGLEVGAGEGFEGSIGGFAIQSDYTHKSNCTGVDAQPGWTDTYHGAMSVTTLGWEFGAGADVVLTFTDTGSNDLNTSDEWLPDDFLCLFLVGEGALSVGAFAGRKGGQGGGELEAFTYFRGRDGAMAVGAGYGGFSTTGLGVSAGLPILEGSGMFGGYYARDGSPVSAKPPTNRSFVVHGADDQIDYFDVDSAVLTVEGKALIKDFVLTYRPLLDNPGNFLILEGDASRTGSTAHNVTLSRDRVLAVYDYLRSLLTAPAAGGFGPACAMGITDSHVMLTPHGESRPYWAGLPDEVENADWRRCTLIIAGSYIDTFKAAGVFVSPEDQ